MSALTAGILELPDDLDLALHVLAIELETFRRIQHPCSFDRDVRSEFLDGGDVDLSVEVCVCDDSSLTGSQILPRALDSAVDRVVRKDADVFHFTGRWRSRRHRKPTNPRC